jgi:hypothetical protein
MTDSIISTLCEARLIRTKNMLGSYNAKDIADLIFLYFLVITILKKDFNAAPDASNYAQQTLRSGNWDAWRVSYNDLGILIHTLFGKENQQDKLKDPEKNAEFFSKIRFDEQEVKNWLRDVVRGIDRSNRDNQFLLNLERNLGIDNSHYKSLRRLAPKWQTLTHDERSLVMTRLLLAFRVRARKSELLPLLDDLEKKMKHREIDEAIADNIKARGKDMIRQVGTNLKSTDSIISTLCEARLIRTKNMLSNYNSKDIADLIFLYFLVLTILKKDFNAAPVASNYAKQALRSGNWDAWRFSYNDLAVLIHSLFGKPSQIDQMKDPEKNAKFFSKIRFDEQEVKNWLRDVVRGIDRSNRDNRFLLNLERNLGIDNSNYRSIRRLVPAWQTLTHGERSLVVTRLLHAFRVRARKSELLPLLDALAKMQNLEIKDAVNPEILSSKSSLLSRAAAYAGLAAGAIGLGVAHGIWKAKKNAERRKQEYDAIKENEIAESASAGATSAGAVASVPSSFNGPAQGYVRRTDPVDYTYLRRDDKNKKTGGMAIAPDPIIQRGQKKNEQKKNK